MSGPPSMENTWTGVLDGKGDRDSNGLEGSPARSPESLSLLEATPATQYRFTGVPPPAAGRGAVKHPNEVLTIQAISSKVGKDVGGKEVVWFEIHTQTVQHEWSVWKRFSDCVQLDDSIERLGLAKLSSSLKLEAKVPEFPTKFHIGSDKSTDFVTKRLQKLDTYFISLVDALKMMHVHTVGIKRSPLAAPLQAALELVISFVRVSSQSHVTRSTARVTEIDNQSANKNPNQVHAAPVSAPASPERSRVSAKQFSSAETPASKIMLQPGVRFTIALFVPGIPTANIFVELVDNDDRGVLVGGRWNPSVETLLGTDANSGTATVLMDSLPEGDFEMIFEIPSEFDRNTWAAECADGILFLIWSTASA